MVRKLEVYVTDAHINQILIIFQEVEHVNVNHSIFKFEGNVSDQVNNQEMMILKNVQSVHISIKAIKCA